MPREDALGAGGETNLTRLLASMAAELDEVAYVWLTLDAVAAGQATAALQPVVTVHEKQGITFVCPKEAADAAGYRYSYVSARITLTVHSSLEAVGLTAAFATRLGQHGISANVVAGFYHDHIFVAHADGPRAVQCLQDLAKEHTT